MTDWDVNGKVALITGAARGIGFGTAQALARRGARIVVVDLSREAADAAADQLPTDAIGIGADVTDVGSMRAAVATAVERFGAVDVVMANAGVASRGATVRAANAEAFERVIDVNLNGVHRTVIAALPEIVRNRGHVVVVSSVYAFMNGVGAANYAMAKAGVEALGRSLRVELAPHGATAAVAYFGFVGTQMVHQGFDADPVGVRIIESAPKPLRKRLTPEQAGEDVAKGIVARQPRIITPKRWHVVFALRGVLNPLLDNYMVKDAQLQAIVRDVDAREGEEQPLTA